VVQLDPDLADLITPYLETRRQNLAEMKAAATRGDWAAVAALGHKILGTAGSYGFHDLSRIGGEIETAALTGDAVGVARGLREIEDYLNGLVLSYAA
jgi:HPt (histidine-containing phosphotransfer) domain-containing protein